MNVQVAAKVTHRKVKAVAAGAAVAAVLSAGFAFLGDDAVPSGAHTVQFYTVDDEISYPASGDRRPGLLSRQLGLCDGDTHYVEYAGGGHCLVLDGPLGDITAQGGDQGAVLPPATHGEVLDLVREQAYGEPTTRVILEYDGAFVGVVSLSSLDAASPVTATPID
ncbi:hypothetical protein [Micromonospora sp. NBC_01813]|uniref:hypothetical protein n=1 Tax=Micromonospora sp. NBC_01813 TaxID=2975988 RepID=UPI002DDC5F28|nr:hypothetical protein [Micromonospora sp. NBC_01813]WSA08491.1 hypothetical protein OG958_30630 [Micromonospora sp. NBC_01813]